MRRVAWGITGSGDRLRQTVNVMKEVKKLYPNVEVSVYLSKAGEKVVKIYGLMEELKKEFKNIRVEIDSNTPFLAGQLQVGRFEFLLIAPATSNTVAKISLGIADTLLTNSAIMALKAFVPVYIMPSDYAEGITETELPDGRKIKIRIRKEDVENVNRIKAMGIFVLEKPEDIFGVFKKHFG
ncbi:MAG: archaeoflavoprotein AfpA [Archaeoglobaceae archaeon]|nr:archaeoflavoprotein AfpA [Archaeoglobaceae archaeon]MCX8152400.1 archaeoflavoprotein AfpA [Archaeoglobaceae archaeon]MDW8013740.1 archaeoflavoprotein AfpA [Archaeoglobaceae archaeon]